MKQEKISTPYDINVKIEEDNIEVGIRYPKRSTLKKRLEMLKKLKEVLYKI